ncbi:hypothetical protein CJF31_00001657 [Rutstroemia sp. NJR-2017a BVV2]|nr:hypothetical protein CJF31_00001657 [Rutstroemia sp. NJR-2017a BVV2]
MSPTPLNAAHVYIPSPSPPIEHFVLPAMERTRSGDSIISDEDIANLPQPLPRPSIHTISDAEAASLVLRRHWPHNYQELSNELLYLLCDAPTTDDNIFSIISLTSDLFFHSSLRHRVAWSWSSPDQPRYKSELLGTTALREAKFGGYETLIVLSEPILRNPRYDRRLLLSTLLHELVHCYLFVKCGFEAKRMGGHTAGFHTIVEELGDWVAREGRVGKEWLRLCGMRGNLEIFRAREWERDGEGLDRERQAERERGRRYEPGRILLRSPRENDVYGYASTVEGDRIILTRKHAHAGCNQSPGPEQEGGERERDGEGLDRERQAERERERRYEQERILLRSPREGDIYGYASTVEGDRIILTRKHAHAGCNQSPGPEQEGGYWSGRGRMSEIGYAETQEGFR